MGCERVEENGEKTGQEDMRPGDKGHREGRVNAFFSFLFTGKTGLQMSLGSETGGKFWSKEYLWW